MLGWVVQEFAAFYFFWRKEPGSGNILGNVSEHPSCQSSTAGWLVCFAKCAPALCKDSDIVSEYLGKCRK